MSRPAVLLKELPGPAIRGRGCRRASCIPCGIHITWRGAPVPRWACCPRCRRFVTYNSSVNEAPAFLTIAAQPAAAAPT